ncbi:SCO family protein [Sinirhodobacter sp. WL0062]|uniref:SCO family protein n=1 Tax=Rhodobacter flavimaris TaxID=2907145 RepID=A0ABS8YXQ9_9RHOB|nr:SCO family protein [Sinirhodobacter sp. WL0062]MCE5974080.1 SCO family protein [Sinirhodobacter sp. WL0062]
MALTPRFAAILASAAVVAGLGATVLFTQGGDEDIFAQCRRGVVGGSGQLGGPFTLVSETGETVTDKDVFTKPSLLYFGYTYCPDVCPLDNSRNAEAVTLLDERGYDVTPVFVSVDTERDTPELLAEFTEIMHPKMLGLTGSAEQISVASKAYRTYFKVQNPGDPYTLIDHSTQTYLVFPEIGFVDFFNRDTTPEQMAEQVSCFVDAWKNSQ